MKNILGQLTLLILFTACATTAPRHQKNYSNSTEKSFEDIERDRALDHYRLLREKNWNHYLNKGQKSKQHKSTARKVINQPKKILVNPEDQKTEIDQHLTYFCMGNRKSSRFSEEGSCEQYAQNSLNNCLQKFEWGEKGLISCTRSSLK